MRILGIDPGSRVTGYGVISVAGAKEKLIEYGALTFRATDSHEMRLKLIYDGITQIIDRCSPDETAIEMPVYGQNPQAMLKLGRAQAASMLASLNRDLPVVQYTPKEVKRAVTGNGNAAKEQVRFMVASILRIDQKKKKAALDATDALAVALCHVHRRTSGAPHSQAGSWARFIRDNPERVK